MQVILTEKIRHLGNLGDKIEVKSGYARNYLIPQNKAVRATAVNLKAFETKRTELEKRAQQLLSQAEQRAAKMNDIVLEIAALASDEGKLYGSVGTAEIKEALKNKGLEVMKKEIMLSTGAFHSVGEYQVDINLHSDVVAKLQIQIVQRKD